ncbi:MAG: rod shape-determining protein [Bacilli bacterium]
MFSKDIGIDLGTANVVVYIKGQGIVLNEPSVVAIDENSKKVLAVGNDASIMLGRTPGEIKAIKPMRDGVIADFDVTEIMLNNFINKAKGRGLLSKPRILICCPSNITTVEKNAIKEAALRMGAKKVFLEEEPKVAAIGSGLDISKPSGCMVVDIGGGTTDIAVLSLGGIVNSKSVRIAGNTFDNDIIKYVKENHKLLIGERTAEDIKKELGVVYKGDKKNSMEIKGRDYLTGLPATKIIDEEEIEAALTNNIMEIIREIKNVLETTLPELSADIVDKGIMITGGGSLLKGIEDLLKKELKVPIMLSANPLTSVAEGTGIMLNNINLIDR